MYVTSAQDSDSMSMTCAQDSEPLVSFAWRQDTSVTSNKHGGGGGGGGVNAKAQDRSHEKSVSWRWQLTQSILTVLSIVRCFRWTVFFSPVPNNSTSYFRSNLRKLRNVVQSELTVQPPLAGVGRGGGGGGVWYSCVSDSSPNKR